MNHLAVAQGIPILPDGPDRVLTFASVTPSTRFASKDVDLAWRNRIL